MSEKTELDPKHIDKRTVARYITQGLVDEKAFEKHIKSLTDLADKATRVETVSEDDPIDDDDVEE
ncbi:MAG: hypothetical protein Q8S33_17105 [Myxococcales bacterium]|nr:hypothetical protein [Myxococcales bacterium]MDP3502058.1 hypothetical protein [Myxococcales bacterium]